MTKKKASRPRSLASSRPPGWRAPSLSSHATRSLIRNHHVLHKQLAQAVRDQDDSLVSSLQSQIHAAGGINLYQQASLKGQSIERGGDSSKVLMSWLDGSLFPKESEKPRLLEVGALDVENACSRSGIFHIERIDLHSQHTKILEQDLMKRPLPTEVSLSAEGFDLISLSLVVNYVADPQLRGEMLKRTTRLLRPRRPREPRNPTSPVSLHRENQEALGDDSFPGLFLVLPASCVQNSRYLDENRLEEIMMSLGYTLQQQKLSSKLLYQYWRLNVEAMGKAEFSKVVIRGGGARNNFAIVLRWAKEEARCSYGLESEAEGLDQP